MWCVGSSQATFSDLNQSTFPDNNHILPSTYPPRSTATTVVSSQATFPETPHTTFTDSIYVLPSSRSPDLTESSSSDTESVSTTVQKSKVLVKRSAKVRPSLSDSSNTGKFKYNDFIGGGSFYSEAIESHKKVKALLNTLKRAITNSGLPLDLDMETPIDGNCFPVSVIQQCQRQEVQDILVSQKKRITDYMTSRKDVADFVISNGDHPKIQPLKNNYELKQLQRMRGGLSNKGWTFYWQDMRKDGEWVDATFVHATAWFTGLDIFLFIVGNANPDNPFARFSGVIDSDVVRPRGDHTLLIGYIDNQHYQSLLPLGREMDPLQVDEALRSTLSALKLELSKPSCEASSSQLAESDQVQPTISDTISNQEDSSTSQDIPSGNTSERDDVWPTLYGFQTEFENEKWKCPFCGDVAYRIEAHLKKGHF